MMFFKNSTRWTEKPLFLLPVCKKTLKLELILKLFSLTINMKSLAKKNLMDMDTDIEDLIMEIYMLKEDIPSNTGTQLKIRLTYGIQKMLRALIVTM